MKYNQETYEAIRQRILDNINIHIDKREGSFTSNMISPIAKEITKSYINMSDILSLGFIEDNFDTFLDKRVSEFGVYRKQGAKAIGEIKVEGYKLDGNLIGCCANKVFLDKDDEYHYSFSCINACEYVDGSETENLRILQYDIEISSDLSEIYIIVWMRNDEENVHIYSKLE